MSDFHRFEGEICVIYPPQLTLKKTTESSSFLSYLDVAISISDGRLVTEVFDKRDGFNFSITLICVATFLLNLLIVCMSHS